MNINEEKRKAARSVFEGRNGDCAATISDIRKMIDSLCAPDSPPAEPVKTDGEKIVESIRIDTTNSVRSPAIWEHELRREIAQRIDAALAAKVEEGARFRNTLRLIAFRIEEELGANR